MKQANHVFEKVTKYAIRKLSVGVGPVAIGTFLLAGGLFVSKPVSADQVTSDASVHMAYVTENELTAEEQKQVVHAIPKEYQNEDTFYLVYKRKGDSQATLPQTGSSDWAATGLGLATATMAVLLFSKKHRKKIIGLVLIGAAGQSLLVPIEVLALQNKELQAYNQTLAVSNKEDLAKGVIAIDGYEYVGYLRYSAKPELEQPLENTLQGLESSIKEDNTVSQGTADRDSKGISWKKEHRSRVMKARQLFNLLTQSTLDQLALKVRKNQVMKARQLFNLQIQITLVQLALKVRKNQVTKANL
ncbi:hypothetical protein HMPREF2867_08520 [Streptococcus sp. HMSC064H09]|nr:hypothetical protein HMPREF2867_08520 [Streptococcus sp. HMSC064H09]